MSSFQWRASQTHSVGIGLRSEHYPDFKESIPNIDFVEVHAENVMAEGAGRSLLLDLRGQIPISLHGVGLSIAGPDPLDVSHIRRFKELIDVFEPAQVSEHLAWSMADHIYHNDLLPFPYTDEALDHVSTRVMQIQDAFKRPILIENPSTYMTFTSSHIPEWDFLADLSRRTDCGILLDLNNIEVSVHNHGYDPYAYIAALPLEKIGEIHLAGHSVMQVPISDHETAPIRVDDHGAAVGEMTWQLYAHTIRQCGATPTLIEWDSDVPELEIVLAEADKAATIMARIQAEDAA